MALLSPCRCSRNERLVNFFLPTGAESRELILSQHRLGSGGTPGTWSTFGAYRLSLTRESHARGSSTRAWSNPQAPAGQGVGVYLAPGRLLSRSVGAFGSPDSRPTGKSCSTTQRASTYAFRVLMMGSLARSLARCLVSGHGGSHDGPVYRSPLANGEMTQSASRRPAVSQAQFPCSGGVQLTCHRPLPASQCRFSFHSPVVWKLFLWTLQPCESCPMTLRVPNSICIVRGRARLSVSRSGTARKWSRNEAACACQTPTFCLLARHQPACPCYRGPTREHCLARPSPMILRVIPHSGPPFYGLLSTLCCY